MALSGSFNTTKYSGSYGSCGLNVSWTATQNVVNNTSTIKWTVKSNGTMSSGYWYYCYGVEVTINGTKVLNTSTRFEMKGDGGYKKSGTIVVAHGEDGSKTVSMSARAKIYQNSWNCTSGTKSFTLNTINRYALLSSVTDFTNESYPTIVYTNPAGTALTTNLKARITWKDTSNVDHATAWVTLDDEGGTYTFDSSSLTAQNISDMLSACPSTNYLSIKFDLQSTMDGTDYHNYKDAMMTVVNANPIFSVGANYQDASPEVVAITGDNQKIVQLQSKLRIYHGTASGQKGASLANNPYILNFNGVSYGFLGDYIEFDKPDLAGTYRATVIAMDSRGNESTSYVDITVLEWSKPTAECSLERQNSFESNCNLLVRATISPLDGLNQSHFVITEKHKKTTDSSWSTPNTVTNNTTKVVTLLNTFSWDLQVTVSDAFASVTYTLSVSKGIPYRYKDRHRNSFGFNGIPDEDNQFLIGEGCHAKIDRVKYPHRYSTTEHIVGYWTDGSPIYEITVDLISAQSIVANTWTDIDTLSEDIKVLNIIAYYDSSAGNVVYCNLLGQFLYNGKKLQAMNTRNSSITIDSYTIQYIKV